MAMLPIIEVPDHRLRLKAAPVGAIDARVRRLVSDLFETMYDAPGIGLAAVQVGALDRVFVMDLQTEGADGVAVKTPRAFIDPEVVWASDERSIYNEGCLSIPEQYAEVERPARVRARWLDVDGVAREEELEGLTATCIQHEIDHLNGVLFIDHITRLKRDILLRKLAKARRDTDK